EVARVAREVLVWPELGRIDEEAGNRQVALAGTGPKEREVALVKGAHGRNQTDAPGLLTRTHERLADSGHAAHQLHGRVASARARYKGAISGARFSSVSR